MQNGKNIDIESIELVPEFTSYDTGDAIVWVPDAVDLRLRPGNEPGAKDTHHSYTCLEQVFLLLDQLETGTSGDVLWGSSGIIVNFSGERVELAYNGIGLVGSRTSVQKAVETLARLILEELQRQAVDSRSVARQLREGRLTGKKIDPVEVHDRLLD